MTKEDIKIGSKTIKDFANFINERHLIWMKRNQGLQKPWTDDPILQQYKFTNVFRQLDTGTIALQNMITNVNFTQDSWEFSDNQQKALIIFNIIWYRLFNRKEHAKNCGFVFDYEDLSQYIVLCNRKQERIFTDAYCTTAGGRNTLGIPKYKSYLKALKTLWDNKDKIKMICESTNSLQYTAEYLRGYYLIGNFVAYEIVCDLRFTSLLENAIDTLSWANLGPGAKRGLMWLGMPCKNQKEGLQSIKQLWINLSDYLTEYITKHYPDYNDNYPPFELREVEHSLCEADKYWRIESGIGRSRCRYNGI